MQIQNRGEGWSKVLSVHYPGKAASTCA